MNHRVSVDFVDPAPSVAPHLVQFAYSEDLRVAVIEADGAGYRVVWDSHGERTAPLADYISHCLDECQAHIQAHAPAWAAAHAQQVELSD
jgi:hypothetical protein